MRAQNSLDKITLKLHGMDELKEAMGEFYRCYEKLQLAVGKIGQIYEEMGLEVNFPHISDANKDDS